MALTKPEFKPGIIKDDTQLASEGGYVASSRVRFRRGRPEANAGYEFVATAQLFDPSTDMARAAKAWVTLDGEKVMAFGTAKKLMALLGGGLIDVTPPHSEGVLTSPFSTTNSSTTVAVAHPTHGLLTGQIVTYSHASAVGGLTISGPYTITVVDADNYTITAASPASTTAGPGGGNVDFVAALVDGNVDGSAGGGYGVGPYGVGAYGVKSAYEYRLRTWSLANWGENLLASPTGGALYEWQPDLSYAELVANGDMATSDGWLSGGGWSYSTGRWTRSVTGSPSSLAKIVPLRGGATYRVAFTIGSRSAGTIRFKIKDGSGAVIDLGDPSKTITVNGTYSRLFQAPADPAQLYFEVDASFDGYVSAVSIKLESKAYRINNAPYRINSMFVTPERFCVLVGTEEADGDFNQLLVRWCDQENNKLWVPADSNLAGEYPLSEGGVAVQGKNSRGYSLVLTDSAAYTMQFTGSSGDVFSFHLAGTGCGLIGPNAIAEHNGTVIWLANTGNFHSYNGGAPQPMDCTLIRDMFDNIAADQQAKIHAGVNARQNEIWFSYPDARDGDENSRIVVFNFNESHWASHDGPGIGCWEDGGIFEFPVAAHVDGHIYYHEKGHSANGDPLTGYLETSFFDIGDGEFLMQIRRVIPDFENQLCDVAFTLFGRKYPNGPISTYGPYTSSASKTKIDMLKKMRELKLRIDYSASPAGWRLGALRLDIEKTGERR